MMPSDWGTHGLRSTCRSCERQGEAGSGPAVGHPLATAIPMGKRDRGGGELRTLSGILWCSFKGRGGESLRSPFCRH